MLRHAAGSQPGFRQFFIRRSSAGPWLIVKNVCRLVMRVATPRVVSGTCILRYLMNDLLLHLPIIWIVSTFTPARYMAMAAPDLIECVPMSSALNPSRHLPIALVAVRSCSSTAIEDRYFDSSSAASAQALIP